MKKSLFKYSLLLTIVLLMATTTYAQNVGVRNLPTYDYKNYHFGFTLGFNSMSFKGTPNKEFGQYDTLLRIHPVSQYGFNIGIVADKRLNNHWSLRFVPAMIFGDRVLQYDVRYGNHQVYREEKRVESTYLEFPFYVKFKSERLNEGNTKVYLLGGAKYTLDLASQSKKNANNSQSLVKLKPHDIMAETGVGFDFYTTYFKLGTELKVAYGLLDLLVRENNIYTQSLNKLNSRMILISFTFE